MAKKRFNRKVVVIIAIIAVIIIGIITTCGIVVYNNFQAKQEIEKIASVIIADYDTFEKEELFDSQIDMFVKMNSEYTDYISNKNSKGYYEEVQVEYENYLAKMENSITKKYKTVIEKNSIQNLDKVKESNIKKSIKNLENFQNSIDSETAKNIDSIKILSSYDDEINTLIANMRNYYISKYDSIISKNKLKNVNEITDKEKLEKSVETLNGLKNSLNKEVDTTIADSKILKEYNKKIDNLIKTYENRISVIEEAEEEARRQKEEERKAAETAAREEQNNNSSYSSNNNNSSNSGGNNSKSNSNNSSNNTSSGGNHGGYGTCSGSSHGGLCETYTSGDGTIIWFYNDGYAKNSLGQEWDWKWVQENS